MSQGTTDEDTGFHNISDISRLAYDYQQQLPPAPPWNKPKEEQTTKY
jgi:hypothetical protein